MVSWEEKSNDEIRNDLKALKQEHLAIKDRLAVIFDKMVAIEQEYTKGFNLLKKRTQR